MPIKLGQRVASAHVRKRSDPIIEAEKLEAEKIQSFKNDLRRAHFTLGNNKEALHTTNQKALNQHHIPINLQEERDDFKARLSKTQF